MTAIELTEAEEKFMRESYEDWLAAKAVIEKLLTELGAGGDQKALDHNSSALLARLSHAGLAVCRHSHMRE